MSAVFSPCKKYRYTLWRQWLLGQGTLLFVMLNPSTADVIKNDQTVTRCINFAQRWGFQQLAVANAFGFRATKPSELYAIDDPIGPDNDRYIAELAEQADQIVVAWGQERIVRERQETVLKLLEGHQAGEPLCLGRTSGGFPNHPLYIPAARDPEPFRRIGRDKVASGPAPHLDGPVPIEFLPAGWQLVDVHRSGNAFAAVVQDPAGGRAERSGLTATAALDSAIGELAPKVLPARGEIAQFLYALEEAAPAGGGVD